jgi:pyruvate/2-oxoglutarate dehydrogenase complex dihydrolipoamide acyltransferase (E2) component
MERDRPEHDIVMPDLDLPGFSMAVSVWFVPIGKPVSAGDRVVEILAGEVTVDLTATVDGILSEQLVLEDEPVRTGQVLGRVRAAE